MELKNHIQANMILDHVLVFHRKYIETMIEKHGFEGISRITGKHRGAIKNVTKRWAFMPTVNLSNAIHSAIEGN